MLSLSFLYCSNVQREQAGIAFMIMREEILCKRLLSFPRVVEDCAVLCFARILENHFMTINNTLRFSNKIQHKIAKTNMAECVHCTLFLHKIAASWFPFLIFDPYIAKTDSSCIKMMYKMTPHSCL